jgi:hypothetical protein
MMISLGLIYGHLFELLIIQAFKISNGVRPHSAARTFSE